MKSYEEIDASIAEAKAACQAAVDKLQSPWHYYYAETKPGIFCVFETATLRPMCYVHDVREARFWVSQYESSAVTKES